MSGPYTQLFVHCVWATWDRLPLITPAFEAQIYASIGDKCAKLGCETLAIGGIEDHVHLLVELPATLAVAQLLKETKGASSHLMTHVLRPDVFFRWQGSYGVFTVSKDRVPTVQQYIKRQKIHHADNSLIVDWETWVD
ncbi:MAG TPA: IS200/IS605 family transposase [Chloroflexia bacterium]|jgi:REP element-mobilizing transposase RayT|nr:IS200/IS605 family transposase [Chloroflexia bacterium]